MAMKSQHDIESDLLDLEEPKSPTFSLDLSVFLSEPNVPFPCKVGALPRNDSGGEKLGVSPEFDLPKHNPSGLSEKATVGADQVSSTVCDKKTVEHLGTRRKIVLKTPSVDLNRFRVRLSSELANPASIGVASASKMHLNIKDESPPIPPFSIRKENTHGNGTRFHPSISASRAASRPWTDAGNQPAKHGLKSTGDPVSAAINVSPADNNPMIDVGRSIGVDLASEESRENRPPAPLRILSHGEMSGLSIGSLHSMDEPSKTYINVNGEPYQIIRVLGEGGSSKVYEVFSSGLELLAIKCVNLSTADDSICESYRNEISVLRRLQGSDRVIKLYDHEFNEEAKMLYVVLERGEVDLASIITSNTKQERITPEMVKFYWSEMLRAVEVIHKEGIIHSDLKPANFLLVAGQLKLIDFGIASTIPTDATSIIKDSRAGTPSYMSPEAFLDTCEDGGGSIKIKIGVKSDVWSLGCILYHLVYKCTPFHHIKDPMKKMLSIVNPNHEITFRPLNDLHLLNVLKRCIVRDPKQRASISELLQHPYLTATSRIQHPLASLMNSISELSPSSIQRISQVVGELKVKKK